MTDRIRIKRKYSYKVRETKVDFSSLYIEFCFLFFLHPAESLPYYSHGAYFYVLATTFYRLLRLSGKFGVKSCCQNISYEIFTCPVFMKLK